MWPMFPTAVASMYAAILVVLVTSLCPVVGARRSLRWQLPVYSAYDLTIDLSVLSSLF